jgi:hypothetical protein
MNDDLKEMYLTILKDLDFGITPSYRRYGIPNSKFINILANMQDDYLLIFDTVNIKLPDGSPHPNNGDAKNISITDQGRTYLKNNR